MKKLFLAGTLALVAVAVVVAVAPAHQNGKNGKNGFRAFLSGYQEVPANSTTGRGDFKAKLQNGTLTFTLRYQDLEGTTSAAHIHFAQRDVNGGIIVTLCGGSKPACPPSGTVTGTVGPSDIEGPTAQGITTGELDEVIHAMRHGLTYVNVHSSSFPNGEIRGQIGGKGGFRKGHFQGKKDNGRHNGNDND